jgi:hypothetical protein
LKIIDYEKRTKRDAVDAGKYPLTTPLNHPLNEEKIKRDDPKLFNVEEVRVASGMGPFALSGDGAPAALPAAGPPKPANAPAQPQVPGARRGGGWGGLGAGGLKQGGGMNPANLRPAGPAAGVATQSPHGYKPTPAQLSIGFIAQHVASDNYFFCNNFGSMKATVPAKDTATADSIKAKWPKDTLVAKLKESFKFCEDAFAQLDDAKLADQITLTFGGQSRQTTRANMVLGHALDMADHYSQISNYMRLNKLLPPTALPRPKAAGN